MTAFTVTPRTAFWDRIARAYAARPVSNPDAYRQTLNRTRAYLKGTDRVLELGCGTGTTALKLARDVGHYTASDLSPGMIEVAREKAWSASPGNLTLRAEALEDVRVPKEGAYDAVLAFNLFHLVSDPARAIADMRSLVRPGGVFVSKTVCLGGGLRGLAFGAMIGAMRLVGKAPPVVRFTVEDLDAMIAAAGFEIVETDAMPASPPARFVVARRI